MAIATDNFNRANQNPLAGNWTSASGKALQLLSNAVAGTLASASGYAVWNANTFGGNQYSQVVLALFPNSTWYGSRARWDNVNGNGYGVQVEKNSGGVTTLKIYITTAWTSTQIGTTYSGSVIAGDIIRIECEGTTIRCRQNGIVRITTTDTTYSSGDAGIWVYGNSTGRTLDDWEGGDLGGGGMLVHPGMSGLGSGRKVTPEWTGGISG